MNCDWCRQEIEEMCYFFSTGEKKHEIGETCLQLMEDEKWKELEGRGDSDELDEVLRRKNQSGSEIIDGIEHV